MVHTFIFAHPKNSSTLKQTHTYTHEHSKTWCNNQRHHCEFTFASRNPNLPFRDDARTTRSRRRSIVVVNKLITMQQQLQKWQNSCTIPPYEGMQESQKTQACVQTINYLQLLNWYIHRTVYHTQNVQYCNIKRNTVWPIIVSQQVPFFLRLCAH